METKRIVTIEMLDRVFQLIIKKLHDQNVNDVEINVDLYRLIPTDEWQRFDKDVIEVGSLFDDFDSLKLVIENANRPFTYVDFDRTAAILRSMSEILNPAKG